MDELETIKSKNDRNIKKATQSKQTHTQIPIEEGGKYVQN